MIVSKLTSMNSAAQSMNNQRILSLSNLLPPLFMDGLRAVRQGLKFLGKRAFLQKNLQWKNRFSGQRVYIIANGPSVASIDRSLLKGERVIVMNNFHKAAWKDEVRPVAHCVGEPPESTAWADPSEAMNAIDSESLWLNIAARGHVKELAPGKDVFYIMAGYEPRLWGRRKIRLEGLALGFQTTAQLAMQVALYMGFTDIRLLGFDHDWLASPEFSKHFYSDEPDEEDRLGTFSYYKLMEFSMRMWDGYYALAKAAEAHGATITNVTNHSFLDVFPRRLPSTL